MNERIHRQQQQATSKVQRRGAPIFLTIWDSQLPRVLKTRDLVLLYQNTLRDHYPVARESAMGLGPEHFVISPSKSS